MGGVLCGRRRMLLTLRCEGLPFLLAGAKLCLILDMFWHFSVVGTAFVACALDPTRVFCEAGAMNFVMAGITRVAFCHFRRQHFMHMRQCIVHFSDGEEFGCIL